jgi:hypothetical protein
MFWQLYSNSGETDVQTQTNNRDFKEDYFGQNGSLTETTNGYVASDPGFLNGNNIGSLPRNSLAGAGGEGYWESAVSNPDLNPSGSGQAGDALAALPTAVVPTLNLPNAQPNIIQPATNVEVNTAAG